MKLWSIVALVGLGPALGGCAGLEFSDGWSPSNANALHFYDSRPYLLVSVTKDCVSSASVISLPAGKRSVTFKSGYGTADLSVALQNGMVTSVGQKTDTKIPETITAAAGLAGQLGAKALLTPPATPAKTCVAAAKLYPILETGEIDRSNPFTVDWDMTDK
ncbi:MAG: hypothetical protein P4L73_00100 [Caulobacteraceae bacterium]|nr:hypothetical protein [Caulobacteraceae bacterium]